MWFIDRTPYRIGAQLIIEKPWKHCATVPYLLGIISSARFIAWIQEKRLWIEILGHDWFGFVQYVEHQQQNTASLCVSRFIEVTNVWSPNDWPLDDRWHNESREIYIKSSAIVYYKLVKLCIVIFNVFTPLRETARHLEVDHLVTKRLWLTYIQWRIRTLYSVLLMFNRLVRTKPISLMVKNFNSQSFFLDSRDEMCTANDS